MPGMHSAVGQAEDAVRQILDAEEAHSYPPLIRPSRISSVSGSSMLVVPKPRHSGRGPIHLRRSNRAGYVRAIVGGEDGEAACLVQLESKQIDHVGFVFHNQDFFVRRNSHRAAENRL